LGFCRGGVVCSLSLLAKNITKARGKTKILKILRKLQKTIDKQGEL
jgi:hypothetical protein